MRDNCTNDCSGSADTNLFQSERNINRQNMNITYASKTDSVNLNSKYAGTFQSLKLGGNEKLTFFCLLSNSP